MRLKIIAKKIAVFCNFGKKNNTFENEGLSEERNLGLLLRAFPGGAFRLRRAQSEEVSSRPPASNEIKSGSPRSRFFFRCGKDC
jgi:hypothetical protein